ncbi:MAG: hypothetical protein Q8L23_10325, partial [Caulobacter sp.]|nr:hypothetical protein [Caulobacter sp.]
MAHATDSARAKFVFADLRVRRAFRGEPGWSLKWSEARGRRPFGSPLGNTSDMDRQNIRIRLKAFDHRVLDHST